MTDWQVEYYLLDRINYDPSDYVGEVKKDCGDDIECTVVCLSSFLKELLIRKNA